MKQFLSCAGYKHWNTEQGSLGVEEHYQKRVDVLPEYEHYPLCSCNDKLFLNITYSCIWNKEQKYDGYEIYLAQENKDGNWCNLKIYALNEASIKSNLHKYEKQLLDMWNVFNQGEE